MPLMVFLVCVLVTYRVTRLILEDSLFEGTRHKVLMKLAGNHNPYAVEIVDGIPVPAKQKVWRRKAVELLTCPFCFSMYPAAVATIVADHYYSIPLPAFYWPAVGAASLAVWRYVEQN